MDETTQRRQALDQRASPPKVSKGHEQLAGWKESRDDLLFPEAQQKTNETYPLKLTQQQRESLIHGTRLKRALKNKLENAGDDTQIVGVTRNELNELYEESGQAAHYALSPHKKRLLAVQQKAAKFFEEEKAGIFSLETPKTSKRPTSKSDLLFQFKITLVGMKPPIWRRIQVQDCALGNFHDIIQVVMGWENCHMHQFIINGERYSTPHPGDFDLDFKNEKKVMLSQIVPKSGNKVRFKYEYDFGDGWLHEIAFEEFAEPEAKAKYPRCVDGARSGPPEDVGGVWGYEEFLEALANPKHERHEEMMEWGEGWDAENFSVGEVNKALRGFSRR